MAKVVNLTSLDKSYICSEQTASAELSRPVVEERQGRERHTAQAIPKSPYGQSQCIQS